LHNGYSICKTVIINYGLDVHNPVVCSALTLKVTAVGQSPKRSLLLDQKLQGQAPLKEKYKRVIFKVVFISLLLDIFRLLRKSH